MGSVLLRACCHCAACIAALALLSGCLGSGSTPPPEREAGADDTATARDASRGVPRDAEPGIDPVPEELDAVADADAGMPDGAEAACRES
jgi:hypothetical protein